MKKIVSNVYAQVAIVIVGGFILFNICFLLAAGIINGLDMIVPESMRIGAIIFIVLLLVGLFFILRSKIAPVFKATFLTGPLMSIVVLLGIFLYELQIWVPLLVNGSVLLGVIAILFWKKLPWVYYLATIYVALLGIAIVVFDIQI